MHTSIMAKMTKELVLITDNRKHDGTHVNMASYMTDSNMAGTTISKHVCELEPLTTEQYMAWQGNQQ